MRKIILILPIFLAFTFTALAQTASIDTGCVPLVVDFDAPNSANYFWDFKDGASSILKSPGHTFSDPGVYDVELRDGAGGTLVGIVTITVYPDPVIDLDASVLSGCPPLNVDFTSLITLDPSLSIQTITWSFGDGSSSTDANPNHTYNTSGTFSVSIQITTNEMECDKTEIFADLITVESVGTVQFNVNQSGGCNAPATIQINNNSSQGAGLTYAWDFGNGTTGSGYDPGPVTYNSNGNYTITLSVTNSEGCTEMYSQNISVGPPAIQLIFPDTVCINAIVPITNSSPASNFNWNFGPNGSITTSSQRQPQVMFGTGGLQTITLDVFNVPSCVNDTTFQVFVDDPSADFLMSPGNGCLNPQPIQLTADVQGYDQYLWNDSIVENFDFTFEIICPDRDSLFINRQDTFLISLEVTTLAGCIDTSSQEFYLRKPYAHFHPSVTQGCAPLEVMFQDSSESLTGIVNFTWDLGDGTTATGVNSVTNTYTEPGEYYVQLIVETAEGCIDTSAGRWIEVGEMITPTYTISETEICLHETVEINIDNTDPRIDSWYVYTDDSRFNQCFVNTGAIHRFDTKPGIYPIDFVVEYNGCFGESTATEQINVKGADADISYMINCETPYDIMLQNDGLNADSIVWLIDGVEISSLDSLNYTFTSRGDYLLTLITEDTSSGCPADTSRVDIFIRDPEAAFEMDSLVCDNLVYDLDASASIDVDNDCSHGYLWYLPFSRPREVDVPVINHDFPIAGEYDVTLIVEDLHGCRDTLTKSTEVFGIQPIIDVSTSRTCLPDSVTYLNQSTSDTTLVSQVWNFGSSDSISVVYYPDTTTQNILSELILTDVIGCMDTIQHSLQIYNPTSTIVLSQGPTICIGEEIIFSATDFTVEGSSLSYLWDFGTLGTDNNQSVPLTFNQVGTFPVTLYYEEMSTGCNDSSMVTIEVIPFPEASFTSSVDGVDPLCHPSQIELTNTSIFSGQVSSTWFVDGDGPYTDDMPTFAFDKGTHEVMLIVRSVYGCADTITRSFTLVGPEGTFAANPTDICLGDAVTFTLSDTVDVTRWEWDFGDGIIQENGNPVTHIYETLPPSGSTNASLVLYSEETGCEYIETVAINIGGPVADFELIDSLEYCEGVAFFRNLSADADQYVWSTDGTVFSNDFEPTHDFMSSGNFEVSLEATDIASGCKSLISMEIELEPVEEFVKIPNVFTPNGDMLNQYFNLVITEPRFEEFVKIGTFRVYNRWGELLYNNETPDDGWDGSYKNAEAPNEVYAYYIEYEIVDCNQKVFKGNVTIIR